MRLVLLFPLTGERCHHQSSNRNYTHIPKAFGNGLGTGCQSDQLFETVCGPYEHGIFRDCLHISGEKMYWSQWWLQAQKFWGCTNFYYLCIIIYNILHTICDLYCFFSQRLGRCTPSAPPVWIHPWLQPGLTEKHQQCIRLASLACPSSPELGLSCWFSAV